MNRELKLYKNLTNDQLAVLSHYLHNIGSPFSKPYTQEAEVLLEKSEKKRKKTTTNIIAKSSLQHSLFPEFFSVPFATTKKPKFTFIDLFAGIGGFRLALQNLGGKCVFSSEWDEQAQRTYFANYGDTPFGDITLEKNKSFIPDKFDVLCAGFPCQAFSKAGKQEGMNDTRGTLFFEVEEILRRKKPRYILLENVRNLVTHNSGRTWRIINENLKTLGYRLTKEPLILSPHQFGIPQFRERVYILGVLDKKNIDKPLNIKIESTLNKDDSTIYSILEKEKVDSTYRISAEEERVLEAWDEFYKGIKETTLGFPVWQPFFKNRPTIEIDSYPAWKQEFIRKNMRFYENNKIFVDFWLKKWNNLKDFTPTQRKFEWQAGENIGSLWEGVIQFRPSGIRVKKPNLFPALVAIVQIPIIGKLRRRLTIRECARLQSFPDQFIPCPNNQLAFKQFGNSVNTVIVEYLAKELFKN